MKTMAQALAVVAGSVVATVAMGAQLRLVYTMPLGGQGGTANICINTNAFFIGNNPSAVALVGNDLYVAGLNNSAPAVTQPQKIVRIANFQTAPAYQNLPVTFAGNPTPTFDTNVAAGRQFVGMDVRGDRLLVNYDANGSNVPGAIRVYDISFVNSTAPVLLNQSVEARGFGGVAWDNGFNAAGFDYDGDNVADGPAIAVTDQGTWALGDPKARGVFGLSPAGDPSLVGLLGYAGIRSSVPALPRVNGDRLYDGDPAGLNNSFNFNVVDAQGDSMAGGRFWRDVDVSPDGSIVAVRSQNKLGIFQRTTGLNVGNYNVLDATSNPDVQVNGQNVQIVNGANDGDYIIYNDRRTTAATQPFATVIQAVSYAGAPVALNFTDAAGSPLPSGTLPDGGGYYDMSWDAANKRLAIADFTNRQVYIFETGPAAPTCVADVDDGSGTGTPDGGVGIEDLLYYLTVFEAGTLAADVDDGSGTGTTDGGVGIEDLLYYLLRFEAGC